MWVEVGGRETPLQNILSYWRTCMILCGRYVYPWGVPLAPPYPSTYFGIIVSCQNFGTKIGKYSIFPQTWRSIVSVDTAKACLVMFSLFSILFCYVDNLNHYSTKWEIYTLHSYKNMGKFCVNLLREWEHLAKIWPILATTEDSL